MIISPTHHYGLITTRLLGHIATTPRTRANIKSGHSFKLNIPAYPSALLSSYSVLSTVHLGTAFERHSQTLLSQHMSMALTRVGGKEDGGIDLQGWWWLPPSSLHPSSALRTSLPPPPPLPPSETAVADSNTTNPAGRPRRIRVLAQCKAEKKSLGPNYVREMEGVMYRLLSTAAVGLGALPRRKPVNVNAITDLTEYCSLDINAENPIETVATTATAAAVGLIVSSSPFSKSALLRAMSSPVPLFLLQLPFDPSSEPSSANASDGINGMEYDASSSSDFVAAFWNAALAKGVLHDEFEVRLERTLSANEGRIRLWWNGERLGNHVPSDSGLMAT
jgi:hypothetical protein